MEYEAVGILGFYAVRFAVLGQEVFEVVRDDCGSTDVYRGSQDMAITGVVGHHGIQAGRHRNEGIWYGSVHGFEARL